MGTTSCCFNTLSIDNNIAELLSSSFYADNTKITKNLSPRAKIRLLRAAEMARGQLMSATAVDAFIDSYVDGFDLDVQLSRA